MKLCFPITDNRGLDSQTFSHFGVAPKLLVVDTQTRDVEEVLVHPPEESGSLDKVLSTLNRVKPDALAITGIGQGALDRVRQQGFIVYRAEKTIAATLARLDQQQLEQWPDTTVCTGLDDATLEELSRATGLEITIDKSC
ncbi:MAG: hypothetical protein C0620_04060 [Desulfuromonas sp.]|nr:MAG: hypothetical protein C0620_04060 [Desulfuromonas sp.]